jgi:hypothetical protein
LIITNFAFLFLCRIFLLFSFVRVFWNWLLLFILFANLYNAVLTTTGTTLYQRLVGGVDWIALLGKRDGLLVVGIHRYNLNLQPFLLQIAVQSSQIDRQILCWPPRYMKVLRYISLLDVYFADEGQKPNLCIQPVENKRRENYKQAYLNSKGNHTSSEASMIMVVVVGT